MLSPGLRDSTHIQLGLKVAYEPAFFLCLLIRFDIGIMISLSLVRAVYSQINAYFYTVPFCLKGQSTFPPL